MLVLNRIAKDVLMRTFLTFSFPGARHGPPPQISQLLLELLILLVLFLLFASLVLCIETLRTPPFLKRILFDLVSRYVSLILHDNLDIHTISRT